MFSFGLFAPILPFLIMLIVSAFGVVSHFMGKSQTEEIPEFESKEIQAETKRFFDEGVFNPFESSDLHYFEASEKQHQTFTEKSNSTGWNYRLYVFNPAELVESFISRPPPALEDFLVIG